MNENEVTLYNLRDALLRIPRSYGEGTMLLPGEAQYLAQMILENYFMMPLDSVPDITINETRLTAPIHLGFDIASPLNAGDSDEDLHHNIAAAIADFLAVKKLKKLEEERAAQREKDEQLAFTLMKAASPTNLKYARWNNVPRELQTQWLAVAEKARQELG